MQRRALIARYILKFYLWFWRRLNSTLRFQHKFFPFNNIFKEINWSNFNTPEHICINPDLKLIGFWILKKKKRRLLAWKTCSKALPNAVANHKYLHAITLSRSLKRKQTSVRNFPLSVNFTKFITFRNCIPMNILSQTKAPANKKFLLLLYLKTFFKHVHSKTLIYF